MVEEISELNFDILDAKSSVAIDESGVAHFSYYDWVIKGLKYAKYDGVSWSTYTVDSAGDVGVLEWDGKNMDGESVASGIYLLLIQGEGFKEVKKLCIIK